MTEVTGRRRCGIAEHRRQIRSLQRQIKSHQTERYANWLRLDRDSKETDILRLEKWQLHHRLKRKQMKYFIIGSIIGTILGIISIVIVAMLYSRVQ